MTSHTPLFRVFAAAAGLFVAGLVSVPTPAQAVTVTLNTSHAAAPPSIPVVFSGSASGAPTGVPVVLQRAAVGSSSWSTIKTGGKVSASQTYSFSIYVTVGTYQYRAKVGTSAYSPVKNVNGYYGRNISVPDFGAPFTFSARLPHPWVRAVKFQFSTNGTTWTERGSATSNSTGWVGIRTYLPGTSYVRAIAPATSKLPTWVGARGQIVVGPDPVIRQILEDTNTYRASKGLPALALHPSLNKVAGNWAYRMHQTCKFIHNEKKAGSPTNYWEQYPPNWLGAAENIAEGHTVDQVVMGNTNGRQAGIDVGWVDSTTGHEEAIRGPYTHIGIGYYFGTNCYKRYYVQNFARY